MPHMPLPPLNIAEGINEISKLDYLEKKIAFLYQKFDYALITHEELKEAVKKLEEEYNVF